ncbi:hypothetical protein DH2020_035027 [Rehmannia glutinosa]|uniref:RNase H type-1 domain-containing protein n=1 Tax=Rehmannia glutinosa TaxID=99300 RepID=A0ABR0V7M0_REHGL
MARECYNLSLKKSEEKRATPEPTRQACFREPSSSKKSKSEDYRIEPVEDYLMVQLDPSDPAKTTRIRILLQGPNDLELEISLKLEFGVTNNEVEYEALIADIKLGQKCQAKKLVAYTDSQLVAMQVQGEYEAKEKTMVAYLEQVK